LHGAVRLHGLTSSPTPETQVRVAWAEARDANAKSNAAIQILIKLVIVPPFPAAPSGGHGD
jgi:hypothetical protein